MLIYKVLTAKQWTTACSGALVEAPVDQRDGYVHFSTASTLQGTLAKWFRGQEGCVLVAFRSDVFGDSLRWEKSRGEELFPHVYGPVHAARAVQVWQLNLGDDGIPETPPGLLSPQAT